MLKNSQLDILNVFLIIFSLTIAIVFPFSWFLIAYAVIGPLHYLTEINWLNEKKYFIKTVNLPIVILIVCTILVVLPTLLPLFLRYFNLENVMVNLVLMQLYSYIPVVLLTALIFAIYSVYVVGRLKLVIGLLVSITLSILIIQLPFAVTLFGLFLPSLIHVYCFTALFMLYGLIKQSKKTWGIISVLLLISVPFIILLLPSGIINFEVSDKVKELYSYTAFGGLIEQIANWFQVIEGNEVFFLLSEVGVKIQIFVTFAYTYHYLNWFSKTTKIGWVNTLTTKKVITILIVWVLSVMLYLVDFRLGFSVSLLLSFLHVVFEFPLNYVSLKSIFTFLFKKLKK